VVRVARTAGSHAGLNCILAQDKSFCTLAYKIEKQFWTLLSNMSWWHAAHRSKLYHSKVLNLFLKVQFSCSHTRIVRLHEFWPAQSYRVPRLTWYLSCPYRLVGLIQLCFPFCNQEHFFSTSCDLSLRVHIKYATFQQVPMRLLITFYQARCDRRCTIATTARRTFLAACASNAPSAPTLISASSASR
jgi:hypothetical protein